jgi:hypothetical protein
MFTGYEGNANLWGVKFFDKDDKMLLDAGDTKSDEVKYSKEFTLEENERIVGVESQVVKGEEPAQSDVVFIIGRLV